MSANALIRPGHGHRCGRRDTTSRRADPPRYTFISPERSPPARSSIPGRRHSRVAVQPRHERARARRNSPQTSEISRLSALTGSRGSNTHHCEKRMVSVISIHHASPTPSSPKCPMLVNFFFLDNGKNEDSVAAFCLAPRRGPSTGRRPTCQGIIRMGYGIAVSGSVFRV